MPSKEWQMIGLRLFYQIIKLHRTQLPAELRSFGKNSGLELPDCIKLGDRYVKDEFRQNRSASEKQYKQFIDAWYLVALGNCLNGFFIGLTTTSSSL